MIERATSRTVAATLALIAAAGATAAETKRESFEVEIKAIRERMAWLEALQQGPRRIVAAAAVDTGSRPRSRKLPGTNTSMSIGGFIYMHGSVDFSGGSRFRGIGSAL